MTDSHDAILLVSCGGPDRWNRLWILRKVLNPPSPVETMELLLDKLGKIRSSAEFLNTMSG